MGNSVTKRCKHLDDNSAPRHHGCYCLLMPFKPIAINDSDCANCYHFEQKIANFDDCFEHILKPQIGKLGIKDLMKLAWREGVKWRSGY